MAGQGGHGKVGAHLAHVAQEVRRLAALERDGAVLRHERLAGLDELEFAASLGELALGDVQLAELVVRKVHEVAVDGIEVLAIGAHGVQRMGGVGGHLGDREVLVPGRLHDRVLLREGSVPECHAAQEVGEAVLAVECLSAAGEGRGRLVLAEVAEHMVDALEMLFDEQVDGRLSEAVPQVGKLHRRQAEGRRVHKLFCLAHDKVLERHVAPGHLAHEAWDGAHDRLGLHVVLGRLLKQHGGLRVLVHALGPVELVREEIEALVRPSVVTRAEVREGEAPEDEVVELAVLVLRVDREAEGVHGLVRQSLARIQHRREEEVRDAVGEAPPIPRQHMLREAHVDVRHGHHGRHAQVVHEDREVTQRPTQAFLRRRQARLVVRTRPATGALEELERLGPVRLESDAFHELEQARLEQREHEHAAAHAKVHARAQVLVDGRVRSLAVAVSRVPRLVGQLDCAQKRAEVLVRLAQTHCLADEADRVAGVHDADDRLAQQRLGVHELGMLLQQGRGQRRLRLAWHDLGQLAALATQDTRDAHRVLAGLDGHLHVVRLKRHDALDRVDERRAGRQVQAVICAVDAQLLRLAHLRVEKQLDGFAGALHVGMELGIALHTAPATHLDRRKLGRHVRLAELLRVLPHGAFFVVHVKVLCMHGSIVVAVAVVVALVVLIGRVRRILLRPVLLMGARRVLSLLGRVTLVPRSGRGRPRLDLRGHTGRTRRTRATDGRLERIVSMLTQPRDELSGAVGLIHVLREHRAVFLRIVPVHAEIVAHDAFALVHISGPDVRRNLVVLEAELLHQDLTRVGIAVATDPLLRRVEEPLLQLVPLLLHGITGLGVFVDVILALFWLSILPRPVHGAAHIDRDSRHGNVVGQVLRRRAELDLGMHVLVQQGLNRGPDPLEDPWRRVNVDATDRLWIIGLHALENKRHGLPVSILESKSAQVEQDDDLFHRRRAQQAGVFHGEHNKLLECVHVLLMGIVAPNMDKVDGQLILICASLNVRDAPAELVQESALVPEAVLALQQNVLQTDVEAEHQCSYEHVHSLVGVKVARTQETKDKVVRRIHHHRAPKHVGQVPAAIFLDGRRNEAETRLIRCLLRLPGARLLVRGVS